MNAFSCFVSGHSSHLILCSILTSRHIAKARSTEIALLFTLNNIRPSADRGKSTILVSLDLSSAFDTIDHHLLLERLRTMFGIPGPVLNWLRSYLADRAQLVKQRDDLSAPMLLQTGVPQGSVLAPILLTSFISPVNCIATQFGVHQQQYADDTQLYMEISSDPSNPGLTNLESALLSLSSWFLHNAVVSAVLLFLQNPTVLDLSYKILLFFFVLLFPTFLQFSVFIEYLFCVILSVMKFNLTILWCHYERRIIGADSMGPAGLEPPQS